MMEPARQFGGQEVRWKLLLQRLPFTALRSVNIFLSNRFKETAKRELCVTVTIRILRQQVLMQVQRHASPLWNAQLVFIVQNLVELYRVPLVSTVLLVLQVADTLQRRAQPVRMHREQLRV